MGLCLSSGKYKQDYTDHKYDVPPNKFFGYDYNGNNAKQTYQYNDYYHRQPYGHY